MFERRAQRQRAVGAAQANVQRARVQIVVVVSQEEVHLVKKAQPEQCSAIQCPRPAHDRLGGVVVAADRNVRTIQDLKTAEAHLTLVEEAPR
jgi:hypothetical protein